VSVYPENLVNTISQNPMRGILLSFGHRCILVCRFWLDFGFKRSNIKVTTGDDPDSHVNAISP